MRKERKTLYNKGRKREIVRDIEGEGEIERD